MIDTILFIIQCIGIASFAVTGAIIGINKKADMLGTVFFSILTAFGGGFIRDITIGRIPRIFTDRDYYILVIICVTTSLACFLLAYIKPVGEFICKYKHNFIVDFTDAMGLSIFCVLGVDAAKEVVGEGAPAILLIFCGFITGVGGGLLRDICSATIPFVFRKNIYLTPAILGATLYTLTYPYLPPLVSLLISFSLILTIRMLACRFKWNLPVHRFKD